MDLINTYEKLWIPYSHVYYLHKHNLCSYFMH